VTCGRVSARLLPADRSVGTMAEGDVLKTGVGEALADALGPAGAEPGDDAPDVRALRESLARAGEDWPWAALALAEALLDRADEVRFAQGSLHWQAEASAMVGEAADLATRVRASGDDAARAGAALAVGRATLASYDDGDLVTLRAAAETFRDALASAALPYEFTGPCCATHALVLLELVDALAVEDAENTEDPAGAGGDDPRMALLEEAIRHFGYARDLAEDTALLMELTAEVGAQSYRLNLMRGAGPGPLLDDAITALGEAARAEHAQPQQVLALANALEDRFLATGSESDRTAAVNVVSKFLLTPDLPSDVVARARSLRGRLHLQDPVDPAYEVAAVADLMAAWQALGVDEFDGWLATVELAQALVRRGVSDDEDAATAMACLSALMAAANDGAAREDCEELALSLGLVVLQRVWASQRWNDAYAPALELLRRRADAPDAPGLLVGLTATTYALRATASFLTASQNVVRPQLLEAVGRLEDALGRPDTEELAAWLHGLAGMTLWLLTTPDDWSGEASLCGVLESGVPWLDEPERRERARRALAHLECARGVDVTLPASATAVLRLMVDPDAELSDEEIQVLREGPGNDIGPAHLFLAGAEWARGHLLVEHAWRHGDVELLREGVYIFRQCYRDLATGHPARPHVRFALARALARLGRLSGDYNDLVSAHRELAAARGESPGPRFSELADEIAIELRAAGHLPVPGPVANVASAAFGRATADELAGEARALRPVAGLAAADAARAALREYARCVLVEPDAATALVIADEANRLAAEVAGWCLHDARPEVAIEVLENGRAMVLHASTVAASGAPLLQDAGHQALAQAWTAGVLTSKQRRELLAALSDTVSGQRLLTVPDPGEIGAALWEVRFDAVIYLLAVDDSGESDLEGGAAIIVRPGGAVEWLRLPGCALPSDGPVLRYLAAYRQAFTAEEPEGTQRETAVRTWQDALGDICDWTHEAVLAPLEAQVGAWGLHREPRLVLIPLGVLAAMPWSAARRYTANGPRYLVDDALVSQAASARQLMDAARRHRLDANMVTLIANPEGDLPYSARAAAAVRDDIYPAADCAGLPAARLGPRRGTPEEVLAALPSATSSGVGVLHISAHAVLHRSPELSHIALADGAVLPVADILRQARRRDPYAPGGAVICDCCATDRSRRTPDEALTLTTAFLAAGAVSVIGTRWPVADGVSAVAAYMLHRFLAPEGRSPADALRRMQQWLLDPEREIPATMPRVLADVISHEPLDEPHVWAAFSHHGR
jgi:hypothetical protein